MKNTISSNLATLGAAAKAAQCRTCFYYPGMSGDALATTISENLAPSMNERTAFELGYGASLGGARATIVFKGIGLATCLDSVHHAVIGGVQGGLVLVLLEDTIAASSPEIIDSRTLLEYTNTLMIEPASMESAVHHMQAAFALSEKLDAPVIIRLTYDLLNSEEYTTSFPTTPKLSTTKKTASFRDTFIGSWATRYKAYEKKQAAIQKYVDSLYDSVSVATKAIAFGYAPNAKQAMHVEHYPIATSLGRYYRAHAPRVHELGSNFAERTLQTTHNLHVDNRRVSQNALLPSSVWEKALAPIQKNDYELIVGDEGRYTFDTTQKIDVCLCMGSAITLAAGASIATGKRTMAVTGDFAYQFAGYQSLVEAAKRGANIDVLLLDDGIAASTGGQVAVAAITPSDIRSYLNSYTSIEYNQLPHSNFIDTSEPGINMYHVRKS